MDSYILTTAVNAGGNGQRYTYPDSTINTVDAIRDHRAHDRFLLIPNRDDDGEPFFVNPDHVVAVYPKEA